MQSSGTRGTLGGGWGGGARVPGEGRGANRRRPPPGRVPRPCAFSPAAAAAARTALRPPRRPSRGRPVLRRPLDRRRHRSAGAREWPFASRFPLPARALCRRSCSNGVENGHWVAMSYRLSAPRFVLSLPVISFRVCLSPLLGKKKKKPGGRDLSFAAVHTNMFI